MKKQAPLRKLKFSRISLQALSGISGGTDTTDPDVQTTYAPCGPTKYTCPYTTSYRICDPTHDCRDTYRSACCIDA